MQSALAVSVSVVFGSATLDGPKKVTNHGRGKDYESSTDEKETASQRVLGKEWRHWFLRLFGRPYLLHQSLDPSIAQSKPATVASRDSNDGNDTATSSSGPSKPTTTTAFTENDDNDDNDTATTGCCPRRRRRRWT